MKMNGKQARALLLLAAGRAAAVDDVDGLARVASIGIKLRQADDLDRDLETGSPK